MTATRLVIVVEAPFSEATPETDKEGGVAFVVVPLSVRRFRMVDDAPFTERLPET
mgnify:CR=1 FL=1